MGLLGKQIQLYLHFSPVTGFQNLRISTNWKHSLKILPGCHHPFDQFMGELSDHLALLSLSVSALDCDTEMTRALSQAGPSPDTSPLIGYSTVRDWKVKQTAHEDVITRRGGRADGRQLETTIML